MKSQRVWIPNYSSNGTHIVNNPIPRFAAITSGTKITK